MDGGAFVCIAIIRQEGCKFGSQTPGPFSLAVMKRWNRFHKTWLQENLWYRMDGWLDWWVDGLIGEWWVDWWMDKWMNFWSTWPVRFCGRAIAVTPSSPRVPQNAGSAVHLKFRSLMLNFWKVTFTAASHMNTVAEPGCISSAAPRVNRLPAASFACCRGDWRKSRQRGRNSKRGWRKVAWNNCFLRCISSSVCLLLWLLFFVAVALASLHHLKKKKQTNLFCSLLFLQVSFGMSVRLAAEHHRNAFHVYFIFSLCFHLTSWFQGQHNI